ncbi:MAG: Succinyl-CoA ligase (ADP-forming) subunit beta [Syntrophaceae bacterium PtaU1.Bin231]|nr:MAG: Succinyl-CoA ligase (ADP-forming) subunit beta [Syntrophaceae bacterium PtaU1.Bin231]
MKIIADAVRRGEKTLSEFDSKKVLEAYSIPVTREFIAKSLSEAKRFAREIGYPVVLKGSSGTLTHKTEQNMVALDIRDEKTLEEAYVSMEERGKGRIDGILVQQMIRGKREFVAGLIRDPQLGPCVMFGLGGIFTEALGDVAFRTAPLEIEDALEMMAEIRAWKLLEPFRGEPAVNRDRLAEILRNLGRIGLEIPEIAEIDINPLIIDGDLPVAVDALVVLGDPQVAGSAAP